MKMKRHDAQSIHQTGFTLLELVATVTILSLLSTLSAPSLLGSLEKSRGKRCGMNLLVLEGAKVSYFLDHPWEPLSSPEQLSPYLPEGIPQCPSGGVYNYLNERLTRCECSLNGLNGDQPANGLHDASF
jgi:prepilin-type N-terminal cleavage/methylation domain-containing protein